MASQNSLRPSTLAQLPAIRTFQMDGSGLGNISNSVNMFRGDVNFPLELISLPGRGGLDVKVAIMYDGMVKNQVDTWNLQAATGILGLGWAMPYETIAIDNKGTGEIYDDEYYLVSGGGANRLYQDGVAEDGAWIFETGDYKPWDIRYYPKEQRWTIVKENGVVQTYGGNTNQLPDQNSYIQWGVKWGGSSGDWIGSSTITLGQKQFAQSWNLAEIRNTWGETVVLEYEADLEEIGRGGLKYTRACYLKRIKALDGRVVNFVYKDKEYNERVREYQIPHQASGANKTNAYQDRYETKFLDRIEVERLEELLFSVNFSYKLKNVCSGNTHNPDFFKRYLTAIVQKNAEGDFLPGYNFDYYTDITDNINRGALKKITYPFGGLATFTYEKKSLTGTSCQTTIYGNGIPRVWFGGDYVVVAYYDDDRGNLDLNVYSWNGNWVSDEPSAGGFNFKVDLDSLQVVTSGDFFALSFKQKDRLTANLYLFHKDMGRFGQWSSYQNEYLDVPNSNARTHLAAGVDFVVACVSGNNDLRRYVWNQKSKNWDDKKTTTDPGNYVLAAFGNYFTLATYNTAAESCHMVLYYLDNIQREWNQTEIGTVNSVKADSEGNPFFNWSPSNDFAIATFIKNLGASFEYEVQFYQWNADFTVKAPVKQSYSVPGNTTEPFLSSTAVGSLGANVEHLWRYDGSEWIAGSVTARGNEETKFAYGADIAIASSSISTEVKVYDPYSNSWQDASIEDSGSKGKYPPTAGVGFVTIGNGIYYQNPEGELVKDRISLPSNIKPDSIVNRAPYYIACETQDGTTEIFLLKNGGVVNTESVKGRILAGFNAFVTYKGDNFDRASQLNLYGVVNESIEGRVIDFPVVKTTINDGYGEKSTRYSYDTSKITVSAFALVTEYSSVTEIAGSEGPGSTPFGKTQYEFFDGLSAQGQHYYYYSLLKGMLYRQTAYDARERKVSCQTNQYKIETARQKLDRSANIDLYSAYIQQKGQNSVLYSQELDSSGSQEGKTVEVEQVVSYEYDRATGLLRKETTYNYNSIGEKATITKSLVYGWEKYDALREQHILAAVVQTTNQTNGKTTAIAVSTWKNWQENKWGEYRGYKGTNENAVFEQWDNQTEPPATDWLKVSEVVSRTSLGMVGETVNVEGVYSSTLWDAAQFYPVAGFFNARLEEATYTGFQEYENLEAWSLSQGTLQDCIIAGDAHTGISSLQLKPQTTLTRRSLTLAEAKQTYIFSAWIKTPSNFEADGGKAEARLQFYEGDRPVGEPMVFPIEGTEGIWKYWHCAIAPSQIQGGKLKLELCNQSQSLSFLVDDICFVPLTGNFQANVYEPIYQNVTARLGDNANTQRYVYDSFQRNIAEIGTGDAVAEVTMSYLTRQDKDEATANNNFVFPQGKPNSSLAIAPAEGGLYENFTNGDRWRQEWESSQPDAWQVEDMKLVHVGTKSNDITYKPTQDFSNYGVLVSVSSLGIEKQQPLGIRMGSQLTVTWMPNQGWTLTVNGESFKAANTGSMPQEWLLVAANGTVLFYADGKQVFARSVNANLPGALQFFAGDRVAFKNVVVFKAPQMGMAYTDGAGLERQTQALEETNCLVGAKVYDELSRPVIETKTARFENTLFGYRQKFVENIDWQSGVLTGEIADYYPQDEGYPYSRTVFEASPLARPIQQGIPGKKFAIRPGNSHIVTKEYGTNVQEELAGNSYPSAEYLVEKVTDANGTAVYTFKDKLGRTIAQETGPVEAGGRAYQKTSNFYDAAGNLVKTLLPNYFEPPGGSQAEAWKIVMEYDFLGRMTQRREPDSGTHKYIYDRSGRVRFMVDAVGLESKTILYTKYDSIGRVVEQGWFSGDWGDGSQLQAKADRDPNYPQQNNTWYKRFSYDGDGSNPYLVGRLWKAACSNSGDGNVDVEEVYDYDRFGNPIETTLTVAGHKPQAVRYEYDNLGNVTKVRYPEGSDIPEVCYSYNPLGQTVGVGTPENPQGFATYAYNADGSMAGTNLNPAGSHPAGSQPIALQLGYNSPGWPIVIDSQKTGQSPGNQSLVMKEELGYTAGGYEGAGYYNGNIAQTSFSFGDWRSPPGDYDYKYRYDNLGRLKVGENSQDAKASLGVVSPTTYDPNGNIETMQQGDGSDRYQYLENTDKVKAVVSSNGDRREDRRDSYTYDANGNVKSASQRHISQIDYNPLTQLTERVRLEGERSGTVEFKYGCTNKRVLKTGQNSSSGETTTQLYIRGLRDYPLLEVGQRSAQYIYGPGGLLAMVKEGKIYYILKDNLGSTRVVLDEGGTVVAAFDYLPFGDLMGTPYGDPEIISYRYTGQEFDAELGLYNYRARFYDPRLGRFYAIDPAGQFPSPYLYAGNNPILYVDPSGQWSWNSFLGAGIGVVGIAAGLAITAFTGGTAGIIIAGVLIGAGANALDYSFENNDKFQWKGFGLSALGGAVEGLLATFGGEVGALYSKFLLSYGAEGILAGVGAGLNTLLYELGDKNKVNMEDVFVSFVVGMVGTILGSKIQRELSGKSDSWLQNILQKKTDANEKIALSTWESIEYRSMGILISAVAGVGSSLPGLGVELAKSIGDSNFTEFSVHNIVVAGLAGAISASGHISTKRLMKDSINPAKWQAVEHSSIQMKNYNNKDLSQL